MKERIVIEDFVCNDNCKRKDCEICFKEKSKKEQVPETYEELKQLVKETIFEDDKNGVKIGTVIRIEYILVDGKSFMPTGEILDEDNDVFAIIRNPARMWQIIKPLIEE